LPAPDPPLGTGRNASATKKRMAAQLGLSRFLAIGIMSSASRRPLHFFLLLFFIISFVLSFPPFFSFFFFPSLFSLAHLSSSAASSRRVPHFARDARTPPRPRDNAETHWPRDTRPHFHRLISAGEVGGPNCRYPMPAARLFYFKTIATPIHVGALPWDRGDLWARGAEGARGRGRARADRAGDKWERRDESRPG
jgi:hypothetical protein